MSVDRNWMSGRHAYDEAAIQPVGTVLWRERYGEFRRKTQYFDWEGNSWWESLTHWKPFDDSGYMRNLAAEGWVTIGYLTDNGPEIKR